MRHALRNHWVALPTDDPEVIMLIGPSENGTPLEIGIVHDDHGTAVIHAMPAREKFLRRWPQ